MARFIRLPQVLEKNGLGKSKTWDMVKNKEFPQPIKLSPGTTVWVEEEVDQWVEDKISEYRSGNNDTPKTEDTEPKIKKKILIRRSRVKMPSKGDK